MSNTKYLVGQSTAINGVDGASRGVKDTAVFAEGDRSQVAEALRSRGRPLRVLIRNREKLFTHRGGDTVVVERLKTELERLGVVVTVDLSGKVSSADYDVVHLFNFVLSDMVKSHAEEALRNKVPYVVTTLLEDVASFHNQSHAYAQLLMEYQRRGYDKSFWQVVPSTVATVPSARSFDNSFAAKNAAVLFTTGERESAVVRRIHPDAAPTVAIPLGCDITPGADPALFERQYGVRDFIFCVGRLESRKNQLMLLRALEDSPLTVVFAAGAITYQPEFAQSVRSYRRSGRTLVVDSLSPEMLASAYSAAAVHALPSWYELPGMVHMEAARYGCRVVANDTGSTPDYVGNFGFYCKPESIESIRAAVEQALNAEKSKDFITHACSFTWERTALAVVQSYLEIVPMERQQSYPQQSLTAPVVSQPVVDTDAHVSEFVSLIEAGEEAARVNDLPKAQELLAQAESINPHSARLLRSRGTTFLAESRHREASWYFSRCLEIEKNDARALTGLGMCHISLGNFEQAHTTLLQALQQDPYRMVAILQVVQTAYRLGKFQDLEKVLRAYLAQYDQDVEIRFCLAGCLFKQGRVVEARAENARVVERNPAHKGARELLTAMTQSQAVASAVVSPRVTPIVAPGSSIPSMVPTSTSPIASPAPAVAVGEIDADALFGEAEERKRRKDIDGAMRCVDQILQSGTATSIRRNESIALRAELLALRGEISQALAMLEDLIKQAPSCSRAFSSCGALVLHTRDVAKARTMFEEAYRISNKNDAACAGLAMCFSAEQKVEDAWEWNMRALSINAENQSALLGTIQLAYHLERLPVLESALREYLELHPADLEFGYALAGCCYAQGKYRETLRLCEQIEVFSPGNARAHELNTTVRKHMSIGAMPPVQ